MKMMYGGKPVKSMKAHVFDVNSNDATMIASDLQSGITAYAKGKKVIGTGKSFEFAYYGIFETNDSVFIPSNINVIEIASLNNPLQLTIALNDMKSKDFSSPQTVGNIIVNGEANPVTVQVIDNELVVTCNQTVTLEVFYGKDNYV